MTTPSLSLSNISKRFPGVQALNDVSLEFEAGEIHAVLGENGSGKSTLLGIASGVQAADTGVIEIMGQPLISADPSLARKLGLATVYQDNSLVPELTVAQNLHLGAAGHSGSYTRMKSWARQQLESYKLSLDPDAIVADISPAHRQFLEIVKALALSPKVLLLDEPTTALDLHDVATLHTIIRKIAAAGTTVVYVSHRLPEVLALVERVSVLRDGEWQGTYETNEDLSEDELISLMVGRPIETEFPPKLAEGAQGSEVSLSVRNLSGDQFSGVGFDVHPGEILGLAGAEGNGQRDVMRALGGFETATGEVTCQGRRVSLNSPKRAIAAGMMMLSGDRTSESIFPALGVRENMTVQVLDEFSIGGVVIQRKERARVAELIDDLAIVTAGVDQPITSLSGGNQQKSVLSRSFLHQAKVVLIEEPTQGVDAKARFDIYQALRAKANRGTAFIIKSGDALELAGLCDRVLVFSRGRIIRELDGDEVTEPNIVSSFLTSRTHREVTPGSDGVSKEKPGDSGLQALWKGLGARNQWWTPLGFLLLLIVLVAAYTSLQSDRFFTPINGRHLFLATAPLALVAMAQLNVLLVGGFDMSVGSIMTITVVTASFLVGIDAGVLVVIAGTLACLGVGVAVGAINGGMVRRLHINPVITTIAMLSVLQGIALLLRPVPGGFINSSFTGFLTTRAGFIPYSIFGLIVLAVAGDYWLYRTSSGLRVRAVGFREEAARRNGIWTGMVHFRAYVLSGILAAFAGLFLATEVGVGHPTVGATYTLTSIAAVVLGGASLMGGRGSFMGAFLGAIFFTLIVNIMPFLGVNTAVGVITSGALTLLAVMMYSGQLPTARLRLYLRRRLPAGKAMANSSNPMGGQND